METNYSYITSGFRRQALADLCSSTIDTDLFLSSVIFRNRMIFIEIHALLKMNGISTKFLGLPRQTPVVFRIIAALWSEGYDDITTKWKNNKKDFEQRPREAPPFPQLPIKEQRLPPNEYSTDIIH